MRTDVSDIADADMTPMMRAMVCYESNGALDQQCPQAEIARMAATSPVVRREPRSRRVKPSGGSPVTGCATGCASCWWSGMPHVRRGRRPHRALPHVRGRRPPPRRRRHRHHHAPVRHRWAGHGHVVADLPRRLALAEHPEERRRCDGRSVDAGPEDRGADALRQPGGFRRTAVGHRGYRDPRRAGRQGAVDLPRLGVGQPRLRRCSSTRSTWSSTASTTGMSASPWVGTTTSGPTSPDSSCAQRSTSSTVACPTTASFPTSTSSTSTRASARRCASRWSSPLASGTQAAEVISTNTNRGAHAERRSNRSFRGQGRADHRRRFGSGADVCRDVGRGEAPRSWSPT